MVREPLYGQEPRLSKNISTMAARLIPYVYGATQASAGVLVDTGNGEVAPI
jgi:hypothetical protein